MSNVIADDVLVPGVGIRIDFVTSEPTTVGLKRRICLIAPMSSSGTATANQVNLRVLGHEAVATLGGNGSLGHLCAKAIFKEHPTARVDFIAVAAPSGVAASKAITFDDTTPVSATKTVEIDIMGRTFSLDWLPAETDIAFATRYVTEINGATGDLFVSAANGGGTLAAMTISAKHTGTVGNDVLLAVREIGGTGGAVTLGGPALTGGTGTTDITTALAAIATTQYDLIVVCGGNADAIAASTTGLVGKLKTHMQNHISGFGALLQQAVVGVTGSLSSAKVGPATHNYELFEYVFARDGQSLPCEWAGAEVGARSREEQIDPNVNRSNRADMPYIATLYGPANLTTGRLTFTEEQDALVSGLSPMRYLDTGVPFISIPRTTYWVDAFSNEDRRLIYVSQPTTLIEMGKDLRAFLPGRYPGAKITPDQSQGDDDAPANVVEVGDVRAAVVDRIKQVYVAQGWVVKSEVDAALANGTMSFEIDPGNDSKLNIVLPFKPIPPLTQFDLILKGMN
jgi:phage tail sheath gpL-like